MREPEGTIGRLCWRIAMAIQIKIDYGWQMIFPGQVLSFHRSQ